jgi:hypothetical protein
MDFFRKGDYLRLLGESSQRNQGLITYTHPPNSFLYKKSHPVRKDDLRFTP